MTCPIDGSGLLPFSSMSNLREAKIWHRDSAFSCRFIVVVFLNTHVRRVVCMSELDNPMAVIV